MFTGLVEKTAVVAGVEKNSQGALIKIAAKFDDLKIGDSVAINGACQTVVAVGDEFSVQAMNETLKLSNLGTLRVGDKVNLERAMPADGRFGGHFVSGHIDGVAKLLSTRQDGISTVFKFEFDTKYIVKKGSIAINGVSLTVNAVGERDFEVNLIPHTLDSVVMGEYVNIEVDMLAKYVEKFASPKREIDKNFLKECGF